MTPPVNHERDQSTGTEPRRRRFSLRGSVQQDLAYLDDIAAHVDELQAELGPRTTDSHDLDLQQAVHERSSIEAANAQAAGVHPESQPSTSTPEGNPVQTDMQQSQHASIEVPEQPLAQQTFTASVADRIAATPAAADQANLLAVDMTRIMGMLEEEADAARARIDHELRHAAEEADRLVAEAQREAERIRDHGQQQARVLLGEVEEIITESQRTAAEIMGTAEEEAGDIREAASQTLATAQEEARKIVESARRDGENILSEQRRLATVRAQEALREQDRLKEQIRRLEERRRQVLQSLEPLIDQLSQMIPAERNVVQMPGTRSMP